MSRPTGAKGTVRGRLSRKLASRGSRKLTSLEVNSYLFGEGKTAGKTLPTNAKKALPVVVKNVARRRRKPWAWKYKTMGVEI